MKVRARQWIQLQGFSYGCNKYTACQYMSTRPFLNNPKPNINTKIQETPETHVQSLPLTVSLDRDTLPRHGHLATQKISQDHIDDRQATIASGNSKMFTFCSSHDGMRRHECTDPAHILVCAMDNVMHSRHTDWSKITSLAFPTQCRPSQPTS